MPTGDGGTRRTLARPRPSGLLAGLALLICLGGGIWSFVDLKINVSTIIDSAHNAADFTRRMFPLDFPPAGELFHLIWLTLAIVVSATLVSVVISIPLALLAARNTTPFKGVRPVVRALIVLARAISDVIFAIFFFRVFGLGGMTGVLAMGMHSVGMVGKLYADSIEAVDEGPRRAIRATGASRPQELLSAVLPQVLPSLVATALHRLDINLRTSVVLGYVGVNGLGYALYIGIGQIDYRRAMALALVLLLMCFVVEAVSGVIRRALLRDSGVQVRHGFLRRKLRGLRPVVREAAPGGVLEHRTPVSRSAPVGRASTASGRGTGRRTSPRWSVQRVRRSVWALLAVALVVAALPGAGVSVRLWFEDAPNIGPSLAHFFPPRAGGMFGILLSDLWTTVEIAFAGTFIGLVLALPLGTLAARNIAPSPAVARMMRTVILLIRAVPELVLAIVFVVVTGLGPVAGVLALGVGSVGLLGKLVADSLEEFDPGPTRAVLASGASRWQLFFSAILPRAWPTVIAHMLFQLDTNIRAATLLGIVGAGGIGYRLLDAARVLQFQTVTTIVLMLLAVVLLVEGLAVWLRRVYT
ncbi:phosphonate ABC transporter permease [Streptomyces sp. 150FB]|nr:phosphonate ABC transporter permease [Streptomyces sp. 150FB]